MSCESYFRKTCTSYFTHCYVNFYVSDIYSRDSITVAKTEPIKKTIIELYSRLREVDVVRSVYWQRKVDSVV